jgi:hypothetical protein
MVRIGMADHTVHVKNDSNFFIHETKLRILKEHTVLKATVISTTGEMTAGIIT